MSADSITQKLGIHYDTTFRAHGPTSKGVDWGADTERLKLRYDLMLDVTRRASKPDWSILDVGCGYGGFLDHVRKQGLDPRYTGVDTSQAMIDWATENFDNASFQTGDFLQWTEVQSHDYIVCNGILTQKLDTPGLEMDAFAAQLIRKMYDACRIGVAFNVMTTKANFYAPNLYYRNPAEMLAWCMTEITPHIRLNHSYPLFEFTVYLFRSPE